MISPSHALMSRLTLLAVILIALGPRVHAQPSTLAAWEFENTLSHGAAGVSAVPSAVTESGMPTSAAYSTDYRNGAACREYSASVLAGSSSPASGSRLAFSVTAAPSATLTISSVTWWTKARSFNTGASGTHNSSRSRLYWSVDNYTAPVSDQVSTVTNSQLADGSWAGSWTLGSSTFTPLVLGPGQTVTFRIVLWDSATDNNRKLRLDDVRVTGGSTTTARADFDALRLKWRDSLTGGPTLDPADPAVASGINSVNNAAAGWSASLNRDPNRSHLWADITSTTISSDFNENYVRLRTMALAHATPGCALYQNGPLRDDILAALDWMRARRYFAGKQRYDNWWHWEIGSPQRLGDVLVLMHDDLGSDRLAENLGTLAFFVPGSGGWMTGANRSDKCLAAAVHGLLARNPSILASARDQLTPVFPYVTTGDGFRTDGSFIQHTAIAYTGSYGAELIKGVARLYANLQGSPWQLTDPQHHVIFDWIENGFAPLYFRGAMPDHVRGRAISRQGSTDHSAGHYIMRSILTIADAAPPERGTPIRAWLKEQAASDTSRGFVSGSPLTEYAAARELMLDDSLAFAPPPPLHLRFQEMDRVVHRRQGYAFGLAMSSSRVYTYESLNQENLRGWFTGDGVLTYHNHDLRQFERDYWATVDPYHLPGATNPTAPRANGSGERKYTGQDWVGGTGLAEFGSAGMRLNTWTGDLTARKSWFFLDDEVVCLGADISGAATSPVHTTVENRRLSDSGNEALVINGITAPATTGWQETLANPSWIALQGSGGIWFPAPVTLQVKREARTGSWNDINQSHASTQVTRNYLAAWINHGPQPSGAAYAYVLLPDADAASTAAYATTPGVEILANHATIQAVRDASTGVTAAHFWSAAGGGAGDIICNGPAAVMIRRDENLLEVAVSDPTWKRTTPLLVTIAGGAAVPLAVDPAITVLATEPDLELSVNPAGARGRSITASFGDLAADDDFASILPGEIILLDVAANDRSLSGGVLEPVSVGQPANGRTSIQGGAIRYQPDEGFAGTDAFIYQIQGGGLVAQATVTIDVSASPSDAAPVSVTASAHDGNLPQNSLDGSLATRWSALGDGQWIQYGFGSPRFLSGISLAWFNGDARVSTFEVAVSRDGNNWQPVLGPTQSSGNTNGFERLDFAAPVFARHLRVTCRGNNLSMWNSITEAAFHSHRNQPPVAPDITAATPEATAVTVDPLAAAGDSDHLPDPLRLLHVATPAHAALSHDEAGVRLLPGPGFVGGEGVCYQVSDGHRVAEGNIQLSITRATTFGGFRNMHDIGGAPDGDSDGDGLPDLIEFASGSDPNSHTRHPSMAPGDGVLYLDYHLDTFAAGVELIPEWSENLTEWHEDGITLETLAEQDGILTLRAGLPSGSLAAAFLRLRASVTEDSSGQSQEGLIPRRLRRSSRQ